MTEERCSASQAFRATFDRPVDWDYNGELLTDEQIEQKLILIDFILEGEPRVTDEGKPANRQGKPIPPPPGKKVANLTQAIRDRKKRKRK